MAGINTEQEEAKLENCLRPYFDILFGRSPFTIPPIPEQFAAPLDQLRQDIVAGRIADHFSINTESRSIVPKSEGALYLMIFVKELCAEPVVREYVEGYGK